MGILLSDLHARIRPVDELEAALVRACVADGKLLSGESEATLRSALSLARMQRLRSAHGDVDVGDYLAPFRGEVLAVLG